MRMEREAAELSSRLHSNTMQVDRMRLLQVQAQLYVVPPAAHHLEGALTNPKPLVFLNTALRRTTPISHLRLRFVSRPFHLKIDIATRLFSTVK